MKTEHEWLVRALVALAKQELATANENRTAENNWPAGQAWNELAGSSQQAFMRAALAKAGIPKDEYFKLVDQMLDDGLDELWVKLDTPI